MHRNKDGKYLTLEPNNSFLTQIEVVIVTMGVHNILRRAEFVDVAFTRIETDPSAVEVGLSNDDDEIIAEMNRTEGLAL